MLHIVQNTLEVEEAHGLLCKSDLSVIPIPTFGLHDCQMAETGQDKCCTRNVYCSLFTILHTVYITSIRQNQAVKY